MTELQIAKKMAVNYGCHDASFKRTWKTFNVYELFFTDNKLHFVGILPYILIKNGKARYSTAKETSELLSLEPTEE